MNGKDQVSLNVEWEIWSMLDKVTGNYVAVIPMTREVFVGPTEESVLDRAGAWLDRFMADTIGRAPDQVSTRVVHG